VVVIGAPVFLLFAAILLVALAPGRSSRTDRTPVDKDNDEQVTPAAEGTLPERKAIDPKEIDKLAENSWTYSYCSDKPMKPGDPELRSSYYLGYMGRGTAKRMRGKVAVIHLRLSSPSMTWTRGKARDVDRAALLAARFFEQKSKEHEVADLDYTPMAWTLSTLFEAPNIAIDRKKRITDASSRELVRRGLKASESSLGATMSSVAATLNQEGYSEVAFLLHLPMKVNAREFAYPAPLLSNVDVAVVFEEPLNELGYVTAHETMHLFGADDLYPLDRFDDQDSADIMRAACLGFGGIRLHDMSAYSIGWRADAPTRAYLTGYR
jgi:hypothetical protein